MAHEIPEDAGPPMELPKRESMLSRRDFIRNTVRLAVAGAIIPGAMAQVMPALAPAAIGGTGPGPVILRDPDTNAKIPVTLDRLSGEPPVVVTAEWNFLPAVVYKVDKAILESSSRIREFNTAQYAVQHPTEPENAILVYDGKCKHLGCTVGWNAGLGGSLDVPDYDEDGFPDGRILCPCHQGQYDIYDLALNVPGTPPPAPLNVIEFDVQDVTLDDTGESFSEAIFGVEKFLQDDYKDAHQASTKYPSEDAAGEPFALDGFSLRPSGWSA